jgi:hypothetical protein
MAKMLGGWVGVEWRLVSDGPKSKMKCERRHSFVAELICIDWQCFWLSVRFSSASN